MTVKDTVLGYIEDIINLTREEKRFVVGASPRAMLALARASQAKAFLSGRDFVKPDDVKAVSEKAIPVTTCCGREKLGGNRLNGMGDFGDFYELTKELEFDRAEDTKGRIRHILDRGTALDKRVVFLVLQKMDREILEMTRPIAENGVIVVFYVITEEKTEDLRTMGDGNRRIIAVTQQDKLEEIL